MTDLGRLNFSTSDSQQTSYRRRDLIPFGEEAPQRKARHIQSD